MMLMQLCVSGVGQVYLPPSKKSLPHTTVTGSIKITLHTYMVITEEQCSTGKEFQKEVNIKKDNQIHEKRYISSRS